MDCLIVNAVQVLENEIEASCSSYNSLISVSKRFQSRRLAADAYGS